MVVTQDPRLINPFKDFIEAGGLENACQGLEKLGNLSKDVFERALSENRVYPYSRFSLEITLSLAKNTIAIRDNNDDFFAIIVNSVVYPINVDRNDKEQFLITIENFAKPYNWAKFSEGSLFRKLNFANFPILKRLNIRTLI